MTYTAGGWEIITRPIKRWGVYVGCDLFFYGTVSDCAWIATGGSAVALGVVGILSTVPVIGPLLSAKGFTVGMSFFSIVICGHYCFDTFLLLFMSIFLLKKKGKWVSSELMKKRKILLNAFLTLPLISPYFKLIFDIVYRADYSSILLDACLAGPCLVLVIIMWARVI